MTIHLEKSCSLVSFVNIYQFVCASSSIGFEIGMKNLIVFVLDHCLSFYFVEMRLALKRYVMSINNLLSFRCTLFTSVCNN